MRRTMVSVFLVSGIIMGAVAHAGTYTSIRCGDRLVDLGASRYEVLTACGEPADRQASVVERQIRGRCSCEADEDHSCIVRTIAVAREILTYDRGPSRLVHYLTMEDGVLVGIETGGYGGDSCVLQVPRRSVTVTVDLRPPRRRDLVKALVIKSILTNRQPREPHGRDHHVDRRPPRERPHHRGQTPVATTRTRP